MAHGFLSSEAKFNFKPGMYAVRLSFRNTPYSPYRDGETSVKCLESAIKQFVGDDFVDCGKGYVTVRSIVRPITHCVHKNLKRRTAFVARYEVPTIDSYHVDAFVGDSYGHVHALMYDSNGVWLGDEGVYVFVDDCNQPKTDLFSRKWAPVPCGKKSQ